MEHQFARRGRGIDGFLQGNQTNAFHLQIRHPFDEVLEGPPQPIQAPHDQLIASSKNGFDGLQTRALASGARSTIHNNFLTTDLFQSVFLQIQPLFMSRNSSIANFHKIEVKKLKEVELFLYLDKYTGFFTKIRSISSKISQPSKGKEKGGFIYFLKSTKKTVLPEGKTAKKAGRTTTY